MNSNNVQTLVLPSEPVCDKKQSTAVDQTVGNGVKETAALGDICLGKDLDRSSDSCVIVSETKHARGCDIDGGSASSRSQVRLAHQLFQKLCVKRDFCCRPISRVNFKFRTCAKDVCCFCQRGDLCIDCEDYMRKREDYNFDRPVGDIVSKYSHSYSRAIIYRSYVGLIHDCRFPSCEFVPNIEGCITCASKNKFLMGRMQVSWYCPLGVDCKFEPTRRQISRMLNERPNTLRKVNTMLSQISCGPHYHPVPKDLTRYGIEPNPGPPKPQPNAQPVASTSQAAQQPAASQKQPVVKKPNPQKSGAIKSGGGNVPRSQAASQLVNASVLNGQQQLLGQKDAIIQKQKDEIRDLIEKEKKRVELENDKKIQRNVQNAVDNYFYNSVFTYSASFDEPDVFTFGTLAISWFWVYFCLILSGLSLVMTAFMRANVVKYFYALFSLFLVLSVSLTLYNLLRRRRRFKMKRLFPITVSHSQYDVRPDHLKIKDSEHNAMLLAWKSSDFLRPNHRPVSHGDDILVVSMALAYQILTSKAISRVPDGELYKRIELAAHQYPQINIPVTVPEFPTHTVVQDTVRFVYTLAQTQVDRDADLGFLPPL